MLDRVKELTSTRFTGQLVTETDIPITLILLSKLEKTLYDKDTGTILNLRDGEDSKNANDVTVDALCKIQWEMKPDDNIIIDDKKLFEHHRILWEWEWTDGILTKQNKAYVDFEVENLEKVI